MLTRFWPAWGDITGAGLVTVDWSSEAGSDIVTEAGAEIRMTAGMLGRVCSLLLRGARYSPAPRPGRALAGFWTRILVGVAEMPRTWICWVGVGGVSMALLGAGAGADTPGVGAFSLSFMGVRTLIPAAGSSFRGLLSPSV